MTLPDTAANRRYNAAFQSVSDRRKRFENGVQEIAAKAIAGMKALARDCCVVPDICSKDDDYLECVMETLVDHRFILPDPHAEGESERDSNYWCRETELRDQ